MSSATAEQRFVAVSASETVSLIDYATKYQGFLLISRAASDPLSSLLTPLQSWEVKNGRLDFQSDGFCQRIELQAESAGEVHERD
jgi:hypothetical protein